MKNLKEKLRKNGGFTLVEMLIVVAIIAILIAISIPMVGNALERSREATDAANERSFKAELLLCYMAGTTDGKELAAGATPDNKFATDTPYCYDAANGKIGADGTAYGQGTDAGAHKGSGSDHKDMFLWGYVTGDGEVKMAWGKNLTKDQIDNANNLTGPKLNGTADAPAVNT